MPAAQHLQLDGFNLFVGHYTEKKKEIVMRVAYILYIMQDMKHWEFRGCTRHLVNDTALISVLGLFSHFTASVTF